MKGLRKYRNKIFIRLIMCGFSLSIFLISCQEPDPFSNTPHIEFNNMKYVELIENGNPDSLILSFEFQDGDGDLGLESFEINNPYYDYSFILDKNDKLITYGQQNVELPISIYDVKENIRSDVNQDTRPSFDCINYDTLYINATKDTIIIKGTDYSKIDLDKFHLDTVYVNPNQFRNNILVKFYRKRGADNYEEIDWRFLTSEYGCGLSFDGRFPVLDFDSRADGTSLQGTIRYAMVSTGFRTVLRKDTFNIRFQIFDRSLNESNWTETGDITLDQLIR